MSVVFASRQGASGYFSPWWVTSAALHSAVVVGLPAFYGLPELPQEKTEPPIVLSLVEPAGAGESGNAERAGAKADSRETVTPSQRSLNCEPSGQAVGADKQAAAGPLRPIGPGSGDLKRATGHQAEQPRRSASRQNRQRSEGVHRSRQRGVEKPTLPIGRSGVIKRFKPGPSDAEPATDLQGLNSTLQALQDDSLATMRMLARVATPPLRRVTRARERSRPRMIAPEPAALKHEPRHSQPRPAPIVERWALRSPRALDANRDEQPTDKLRRPAAAPPPARDQHATISKSEESSGTKPGVKARLATGEGKGQGEGAAAGGAVTQGEETGAGAPKDGDGDEQSEGKFGFILLTNTITLDRGLMQDHPYWRKVHHRIQPLWDFPMRALVLGRQGTVLVSFRIDPLTGAVQELQVQRSSGIPSFDQNVVAAVEQASPFGPMPADTPGRGALVHAPFRFHNHTLR